MISHDIYACPLKSSTNSSPIKIKNPINTANLFSLSFSLSLSGLSLAKSTGKELFVWSYSCFVIPGYSEYKMC